MPETRGGGAGLANLGGAPIALLEKPDGVRPPLREGVAVKFGRRNGDSGRGSDGRPFGLNCGLGARAPGPTDCENLGIEGVSGLKWGLVVVERLKLLYDPGVVGVGEESSDIAEERFCARWTGRKMPEPGTDVLKYCLLLAVSTRHTASALQHPPVHLAVVLPARRVLLAQLHAREDALLVRHSADKLDNAVHAAGHVDLVAHADVLSVCAHSACGRRCASDERIQ
jgi:hypothetical protein